LVADAKLGDINGWQQRHNDAILGPKQGFEHAIVHMLDAWLEYAETHQIRYESKIGGDGVLGDPWAEIGRGILQLLNGDCGRIDCGTIDALVRNTLRKNGVEEE
jgi:hypothetical protein